MKYVLKDALVSVMARIHLKAISGSPALVAGCFLFLMISCRQSNRDDVDGGDCHYRITGYPAAVIEVTEIDSAVMDLTFAVFMNATDPDTITYYEMFGNFADRSSLADSQYAVGKTWCYQHHQIESGSCTPDIFTLSDDPCEKEDGALQ